MQWCRVLKKKALYITLALIMIGACTGCSKANAKYYYESAVFEFDEGNYKDAKTNIDNAIKEVDDNVEYYICKGMVEISLKNYDDAVKAFEKAQELNEKSGKDGRYADENSKLIYRGMGIAKLKNNDAKTACELFDKALAISYLSDIDIDIKRFKIEAAIMNGDYETANSICDEVMKEYSNDYDIYVQKASCCIDLEKYDEALNLLETAKKNNNNLAYYYLSVLYKKQGKIDEAVNAISEYMNKDKDANKGMVYAELAESYIESGNIDKAAEMIAEGNKYADDKSRQLLTKYEIIINEKKLDFKAALSKATEYVKTYPEDELMQKEVEFLKTRITE
ncbi:MAG: tetratricopeptide repeat protein [Lachnospiraceae bacterium]|nr:tetratricopeptide repeat protein [Lachnospiraceae bacterium]